MDIDSTKLASIISQLVANPKLVEPTLRYLEQTGTQLRAAEKAVLYPTPAEAATDVETDDG